MKQYKNILMINYGGIGDEILFLPAVSSVRKQYKDAKITLALEPRAKSIKNLSCDIDDVICVDIKAQGFAKILNMINFITSCWFKNYDCVISSGKNPLVALILFLTGIRERIGYKSQLDFLLTKKVELNENQYAGKMYHNLVEPVVEVEYSNPSIEVCDDDVDETFEIINELDGEFICIHPGVSKMSILKNIFKCPGVSFWNKLIEGLLEKDKKVVLLGTNDDKDLIDDILQNEKISSNPNFINFFNKTKNLKQLAWIMKKSKSVICVDSAPLHAAVCVGAEIFAVFAPTNELKLVPKCDNIKIIKNDIPCRPCLWHKRMTNCKTSKCLNIDCNLILNEIN